MDPIWKSFSTRGPWHCSARGISVLETTVPGGRQYLKHNLKVDIRALTFVNAVFDKNLEYKSCGAWKIHLFHAQHTS